MALGTPRQLWLSFLPLLSKSNWELPRAALSGYVLGVMSKEGRQRDISARETGSQKTSCTRCGMPLDMPITRFLCQHIFQRSSGSISEHIIRTTDSERRVVVEVQQSYSIDPGKFFQSPDGTSFEVA
ncbi:hypothetical protein TRVL_04742 [Trypanosoma vivax]|uniref:Uncharacterized protein n=1 Tax=Trypanosoma vivax (strain Y486) TaxID=1055687 RepID=G0TZN8_TRYVY|nr:hypothetical protein TRVL_04742 [Trypanosoma vivax]CCC50066.1 conserved hypothetical protein [Trypanosoma vivax Y486]